MRRFIEISFTGTIAVYNSAELREVKMRHREVDASGPTAKMANDVLLALPGVLWGGVHENVC
jgi:hypothetical protein